ncbi:DNA-directed RNA polymerase III subunit RPC8 [Micractinium conductrix]|uniref:DNA-directed RNA polymerase III subunit RPC8 n=1 Tax=Micractinium conductrix TaxID=554055 RepID=A0A2P6V9F8_9CHLO|nr:DNA-directed RNA polymerase III subunit RPC8 [Micractinium conductrix]|eukprot:PSC70715.1 DNA-directed RNA polymerase III subunit RPC8 [Micractinium conductrix]
MFIVSTLEDTVRIAPQDLGKPAEAAITAAIERTFLDKVVQGLGLVFTLYDLLSIGDGYVYPSDGGAHYKVSFRVVVFRPFQEELLVGKVHRMTRDGIFVDMGFFRDVLIPPHGMPEPSYWHEADEAWLWRVEGQDLFFEKGLPLRFKVQSVRFHAEPTLAEQQAQKEEGVAVVGTTERPFVPMEVMGKADGDGLGMVHWYAAGDDDMAV